MVDVASNCKGIAVPTSFTNPSPLAVNAGEPARIYHSIHRQTGVKSYLRRTPNLTNVVYAMRLNWQIISSDTAAYDR